MFSQVINNFKSNDNQEYLLKLDGVTFVYNPTSRKVYYYNIFIHIFYFTIQPSPHADIVIFA